MVFAACYMVVLVAHAYHFSYGQTQIVTESNLVADLGSVATLSCDLDGLDEAPVTYSWAKCEIKNVRKELTVQSSQINLINVNLQDGGHYECNATNAKRTNQHTIIFHVNFAPYITLPYKEVYVSDAQTTVLHCIVVSSPSQPVTDAYWTFEGERITVREGENEGRKYKMHQAPLELYRKLLGVQFRLKTASDLGRYTCVIKYEDDVLDEVALQLKMPGLVEVSVTPKEVVTTHGQSATFFCNSSRFTQHDELTWSWTPKGGELGFSTRLYTSIPNEQRSDDLANRKPKKYTVKDHRMLIVHKVEEANRGIYVCSVNGISAQAQLIFTNGVVCDKDHTEFKDGNPLELGCTVHYYGAHPTLKSVWEHEELTYSSVNEDSDGVASRSLRLRTAEAGHYMCKVSSVYSPFKDECTIYAGPPPMLKQAVSRGAGVNPDCATSGRTVSTVFVVVFGVLMFVLVGVLFYVVIQYQTQIAKYRNLHDSHHSVAQPTPLEVIPES